MTRNHNNPQLPSICPFFTPIICCLFECRSSYSFRFILSRQNWSEDKEWGGVAERVELTMNVESLRICFFAESPKMARNIPCLLSDMQHYYLISGLPDYLISPHRFTLDFVYIWKHLVLHTAHPSSGHRFWSSSANPMLTSDSLWSRQSRRSLVKYSLICNNKPAMNIIFRRWDNLDQQSLTVDGRIRIPFRWLPLDHRLSKLVINHGIKLGTFCL